MERPLSTASLDPRIEIRRVSLSDTPRVERPSSAFSTAPTSELFDPEPIIYRTLYNHPSPLNLPLLVLDVAALTAISASVPNDVILETLLAHMDKDQWVGEEGVGGYCLVILAAEDHTRKDAKGKSTARPLPSIAWWLLRNWPIPRKFRKNMKRLYLVHPNNLTRTAVPILLRMVSPKAFVKLNIVPSLLALTRYGISLRGIDIVAPTLSEEARVLHEHPELVTGSPIEPPAQSVLGWGLSSITSAVGSAGSYLLGRPPLGSPAQPGPPHDPYWTRDVDEVIAENHSLLPHVLLELSSAILKYCTDTEGIFRRSASRITLDALFAFQNLPPHIQPDIDWFKIAQADPVLPPVMLKRLLGSFASPLIPQSAYEAVRRSYTAIDIGTHLVPQLSSARSLVLYLVTHMAHHLLPFEGSTKMTARNLAIVLAPALIAGPDPREDALLLLEPGRRGSVTQLLSGCAPSSSALPEPEREPQTLVGLLETWITFWPGTRQGTSFRGRCECDFPSDNVQRAL